jgi:hypothetical protein
MLNYNDNYLKKGLIVYPPELQMKRSVLMLSKDDRRELIQEVGDSALLLYEFYIEHKGWRHFNPLDYASIGSKIGWTARKTENTKGKLVKSGYLLVIKDTLKDSSVIYRVLLGKRIVDLYNKTGTFPIIAGVPDEDSI